MSKIQEPTPAELKVTFNVLAKEIGPKCLLSVYVGISFADKPLYVSVQPKGYSAGGKAEETFSVQADTWADLIAEVRTEWAKRSDNSRAQTIRDMALAIIRITADLGQCTDAALRAEFDPTDVERYGAEAIISADEMASNGPFSIVATVGANAKKA